MLPEYISTILWPFTLKCSEDRLNNLVHCADGRTPFQTITSLDSGKIEATNFYTFGCPCMSWTTVLEWVCTLVACHLMPQTFH
jgi:hypothetical protein